MKQRYAIITLSLLLLFLLKLNPLLSQPNPYYQVTVESGGNIGFEIYSMEDYQAGGITYSNWTTEINIVFTDTTSGQQTNAWRLGFRAMDTEFGSAFPTRSLPLDIMSIQATGLDSLGSNSNLNTDSQPLSNTWTPIVEDADEGVYKLSISYTLDSALIGHPPAFYNTLLEFQVVESGDPFN